MCGLRWVLSSILPIQQLDFPRAICPGDQNKSVNGLHVIVSVVQRHGLHIFSLGHTSQLWFFMAKKGTTGETETKRRHLLGTCWRLATMLSKSVFVIHAVLPIYQLKAVTNTKYPYQKHFFNFLY